MVWLCEFVCFDGIEEKKLVDEVVREKGERKKEYLKKKKKKKERGRRELCGVWNVLECGGSGRGKRGKKKRKEKGMCVEEKKREKKIWMKKK